MSIYILIGIDPFAQPGIDFIFKFDTMDIIYEYIEDWLTKKLTTQRYFLSGLKGNIETHIKNYMEYLKENNELLFYGEYKTDNIEPYTYKWNIYKV